MKYGFQSKIKKKNKQYSDETAHYKPSHLDLHCLQKISVFGQQG